MSVDSRIVTMKFDNKTFEQNARTSLSTLDKLKQSMSFSKVSDSATKSIGGLSGILSKFGIRNPFASATAGATELNKATQSTASSGLSTLEGGITHISAAFVAMSTVAITALANITSRAVNAGLAFSRSFTVGPILDGLHEYQTNLQSIQTIQANTDRPLTEINASLDELNHYSDRTIYNFSEMARNIGTFTAAGVDLKTATSSIKGIANMAALSGSTSQQAATAMYQLSQAISSGRVGLMDWNSVVNAGMGGKKLQNALAQTGIAMGMLDDKAVKMVGPMQKLTVQGKSFRESIMADPGEKPWLTGDVLVNTLATLDGRFSKMALSTELTTRGTLKYTKAQVQARIESARTALEQKNGVKYTDEQFKSLMKLSDSSFLAATQVKTLGQVFDVAKETIGSGWGASFRNIFGDFGEAKKTFTDMSNAVNNIINQNALQRNKILSMWHDKGGRAELLEGIESALKAIGDMLGAVSDGFHDVFPPVTAKNLLELTHRFAELAHEMKPSKDTLDNLRSIASGVASVFSIVFKVIGGVVHMFGQLASSAGAGSGGFLEFAGGIGEALTNFNKFLDQSGVITTFFDGLAGILSLPIKLLGSFASIIGGLFDGYSAATGGAVAGDFQKITDAASPIESALQGIMNMLSRLGDFMEQVGESIGHAIANIGKLISGAITPETFSQSLGVINTALLGGIVLMLRNFFSKGFGVNLTSSIGQGVGDSIKETLGAATGALQNMQGSLKADILLKIAAALALLTASIFVLSTIPGEDLRKSLIALGVGLVGMQVGLVSMLKATAKFGIFKIGTVAAAIVALAASLLLLSVAVKIMASMELGDMLRGLFGLWAALKIIQGAMAKMDIPGIFRASAALLVLGVALNVIAVALKIFATMSWDEMAHGLAALAGALAVIGITMRLMPNNMVITAAGLVILGVALVEIAGALKIFATMSWDEMVHGMVGLAGALIIIGGAIQLMPGSLPLTAAGLVLVGIAITEIAGALKIMGGMSWDEIVRGLATLGGAMVILAAGLTAMSGSLLGAAALVVAAGALNLLAPVLVVFGAMNWGSIIKSLVMLAGVFTVLGVAGLVLAPLVPVLLGLGAAMVLIGAGFTLVGVGALAFATAIGVLVAVGTAGIQLIKDYLTNLVESLPDLLRALGEGVVAFIQGVASQGPKFVTAMSKILGSMLDAVIKNVPKMGKAFMALLNTALKIISQSSPRIFAAGTRLIVGFLRAIEKNIGKITGIAIRIITNFITAVGNNAPKMVDAGAKAIIKFINGLAKAIDNNSKQLGQAEARLGLSIVRGIASGITGAAGIIKDAAVAAAHEAFQAAKDFFHIGSPSRLMRDEIGVHVSRGLALGIGDAAPEVNRAAHDMGSGALDTLKHTMRGVSDALSVDGNMNPTISPILDLTSLTREANKMGGILATKPITAQVSYVNATGISQETQATQAAMLAAAEASNAPRDIKFEQTNISPRPIDPVTIYRQTRNQISLAKEALKTP